MTDRKGITEITAPVAAGSADTPLAVHYANEQQGGMKYFKDTSERDAFATKYKPRLYRSVAYVNKGENNYPSLYAWSGSNPNGSDGNWQFISYAGGFVLGDTTGGIPHLISTLIFGDDFAIQSAGDQGNGSLVQLSDAIRQSVGKGGSLTISTMDDSKSIDDVTNLKLGPYLEINSMQVPGEKTKSASITVKPDSFQPASATGYLAYLQYDTVVTGKEKAGEKYRKGAIWFDMVAVGANGMLQLDKPNKAIGLQETDNKDPNVTGGSKFLVWPFIYLEGDAPSDGYVELIWFEKDTGNIATDINGHAMAVRHNYKQDQELTPKHDPLTFCQVIAAKGVKEYGLAIVDNFDDYIRVLNYSEGPSGICIQELSQGGNSSEALIKAEIDTGFNVRVESLYLGTYLASINYFASITQPVTKITAGSFAHAASEFEIYAVTDINAQIDSGDIQIEAVDLAICDFYVGLVMNPVLSRAMSGKEISVDVSLIDKDDGWNVGFFTYSGDLSKRPPLYTSRNNGSINLGIGWSKFGSGFISEDVVSGLHAQSFSATIPKDSQFVMVALYPVDAQNPVSLTLRAFTLNNANPETLYEVNSLNIAGLQHIDFVTDSVKLVQDTQGFASLRYTINDNPSGMPMPLGIPQSKMRYVHLDKTKNVISGSAANGGEGALLDDEPVQLTIYQKWQLYNEQAISHEADFWLVLHKAGDGSETEIPRSRTQFIVDPKRPGVDYFQTNTALVNLEPGDYVFARSSADAADGAYAQTTAKASPLCITYVTEKGLA